VRRDAGGDAVIRLAPEVETALAIGRPVVALETTLIAHGLPGGEGIAIGLESERLIREAGAVPATVGVLDGAVRVGLERAELERFDGSVRKAGPRDLGACVASGEVGATTAGATMAACRAAGIRFISTGGLGGVHRGFPVPPDVSADLTELARTQVLVVAAGMKSLLDVPATAEVLETLGVPVVGWQTDTLPRFYVAAGGPRVSARVESAEEAARFAQAHWSLGLGGMLLARPPDTSIHDIEPMVHKALEAARAQGVSGQELTPFALAYLHRASDGRTVEVNKELVLANATLAAEVAVAAANA
jgi:pseudouridylate synthase